MKTKEPIAIVGIGCRFPGGSNSPEQFWKMLRTGVDAVTEIPEDRWDADSFYDPEFTRKNRISVRSGGFIDEIDMFDAGFFGISPREASYMDPQQRILLEVTYQALEDAGQRMETLSGSRTGVFIGISSHDYGDLQTSSAARIHIGPHTMVGGANSIASNRISYLLNLKGPSLSIDTACSSALNATHVACQSLWNNDCDKALVGGVNLILRPEITMAFSKGGFLSPDGRSFSFDERANGYIRSEGAGIVLLKPLSKALEDEDRIYAAIISTAVNQDGATAGISFPNKEAQKEMLREAYKRAGITATDVQYIEAHGTGTAAGDPLEARALGEVIGMAREEGNPCIINSVKANIGHLESASGIAGMIKLALSMHHGEIPGNIHLKNPNPKIPFKRLNLTVPPNLQPWPDTDDGVIHGGVNSFGFGGANAHIVMERRPDFDSGPGKRKHRGAGRRPGLFTLSAQGSDSLKAYAKKFSEYLGNNGDSADVSLDDICYTTGVRKSHLSHRLAAVARTKEELRDLLDGFLRDEASDAMPLGRPIAGESPGAVFIYSGQGPQWWAMGRELYEDEPVFRESIKECDALIIREAGWSLIREFTAEEESSRIHETPVAQPSIFALQVALTRLWASLGVEPSAVVGHSVGEVAAAHVSGHLNLEDAVRVILNRSRVQHRASGKGRMLAVGMSEEQALEEIAQFKGLVDLAAVNAPKMMALSGDAEPLEALARDLDRRDIFHRFLHVPIPFHCYHMDPLKDDLVSSLQGLSLNPTTIPLYSTVTGALVEKEGFDAEYWFRNVRQSVLFVEAVRSLIADGFNTYFVEISPHPILSGGVNDLLEEAGRQGLVVPSLRRKNEEIKTILVSLGSLHTMGFEPDLARAHEAGGFVRLPFYPWKKESHWIESEASRTSRLGLTGHPLLLDRTASAGSENEQVCRVALDVREHTYLADHKVQGPIIFPGAGYVELAVSAALDSYKDDFCFLEDIHFERVLFLPEDSAPPKVQLEISGSEGSFQIASRAEKDRDWVRHVSGKIRHKGNVFHPQMISLSEVRKRVTDVVPIEELYTELYDSGLALGPTFQVIEQLWRKDRDDCHGESIGEIIVPESLLADFHRYNLHPAMLDACYQALFGSAYVKHDPNDKVGVYIPIHIQRAKFYRKPSGRMWSYCRLLDHRPESITGDIWIFDDRGRPCAEFQGFKGRYLEGSRGDQENILSRCLYEHRWTVSERPSQARVRTPEQYLPSPPSLEAGLTEKTEEIKARPLQKEYFDAFEPELDRLAAAYIVIGLKELDFAFRPDVPFTPDSLAYDLGVVEAHRKLFTRMLEILEEDGVLETNGSLWTAVRSPEKTDSEKLHQTLLETFPAFAHELALLGRCGPHIAGVLKGEVDPVPLLFPEEEWDAIVTFYRESFSFRKYNEIVQESVRLLLAGLPEDQTLRILEIGAGTGGVTSVVLPLLPAERTEYTFTDLSAMFLVQAQEQFQGTYPFMKFQRFDVEEKVDGQGPDPHGYDLVIASDVLHATRSLRHTLSNVQDLLASRGTLLMLEVTRCPWWLDLVFGMTEGWWMFNDLELRPGHPSLPADRWTGLLEEEGFSDILGVTDAAEGQSAQHVFLAKNREFNLTAPAAELPEAVTENPGTWVIFRDETGVGDRLAEKLRASGQACTLVTQGQAFQPLGDDRFSMDPAAQEHADKLLRHVTGGGTPLRGIFHLWSLDSSDDSDPSTDSVERSCVSGLTCVLNLIRALTDINMDPQPNLWLITAGAQPAGAAASGPVALEQAPLWGLGRVIMNEHPSIPCTCVDLGHAPGDEEIDSLFFEICEDRQEEEVALRGGKRYVHKLLRLSPEDAEERAMKPVNDGRLPFRLTIDTPGMLDNLRFRETAPAVPGPGEVEIEVAAAGLNFKDVMIAMGLLDKAVFENVYTGTAFGMECSGRVLSVGEGVTGLSAGDEVVALGPGCFGASIITNSSLVRKKPSLLTHEEAAAVPIAYLTASYCLLHLGRLSRGEKVLIHSASGGVGLAALSLARLAGAEIFATAGSREKRKFLRTLGVEHVMDSRALNFADQILDTTSGRGVDMVLNSLAKDALSRSIDVLAPYGRFIEIGKTDIYGNSRLGLRPFADNLSYFAVDIDKLLLDRAELCGEILGTCLERFEDGSLTPPLHKTFPASRVADAFHFMAQAKQMGKVVVAMNQGPLQIAPSRDLSTVLRPDASYLITGGCSGFGLSVAAWLADCGARHLVLMSRSGVRTAEEKQAVQEMRNEGVQVLVAKADVTREDQVAGMMKQVETEMPPLRGVIHAAMVLEDTILTEIDHEKLMKVVRPKALGALNLHRETLDKPLDFFLSFSSMSAIYGNAGQGNYSAANAFLDAFSYYRRALGLPATTINWGVIGEVGYVARNMKVSNILASQGWKSFNQHQTAAILEQILLTNPVQSIALDADWPTVAKFYPMALESPRFSHLVLEAMDAKSGAGGPASSLRQALLDAPPEKRDVLLRDQLHEQVARIIGTSSKKIDVQDPISTMGLDSLMANQLRNWIQQNLQLDFSLMRVMRGPSIQELTGMLAEDLQAQESGAAPAEGVGELDKWVLRNKPVPDAKMRLFCFPYMAGGASVFFDWSEFLPRNIEVCSIQLPGREERSGEEPFQDIDPLVEKVADLILPLLDKPFAFYGHSFGAGIGFKLSHYLFTKHGLLPEHLFIGAWLAPHLHNPFRILDRIKAKDFTTIPESLIFEHLRGLEMPESVLSNADLMNEMMPSIRADMMMGKRYTHSEDTPLACRITAFAGSEDSVFSVEQVSAWSKHSSDGFQLEVIPGGHLFLNENKETLLKIMSEILSPQKP